jgi:hypothetical protein
MKILIKFPTRNRKDIFFNTLNTYYEYLDDLANVKFVISCDTNDDSMNNKEVKKLLDGYKNLKYYFGNSKTKIEAVNNDMQDLDFDILLLASDDMIPQIKGYDTIIKNDMKKYYPTKDGILWYFDGFNKSVNTLSIMGVEYYKKNNYLYYPMYRSFFCDTEQTILAQKLNKITFIDNTIIKHLHPDNTKDLHKSYDNTYKENDGYDYDKKVFIKRMKDVMNVNLDHL